MTRCDRSDHDHSSLEEARECWRKEQGIEVEGSDYAGYVASRQGFDPESPRGFGATAAQAVDDLDDEIVR